MLEYVSGSASAAPMLDDRARLWIRDLELKAKNHNYLSHPDFLFGYRFAYEECRDEMLSGSHTLSCVIDEIEYSLSHSLHRIHSDVSSTHPSYAWCVGSLFGYLALLLQFYPDRFLFLAQPVCHVQRVMNAR
jgi:hypothetical protein